MFRYRLQSQDPSETLSELDGSLEISYGRKEENQEKRPVYFDLEPVESQEYEKHENRQFAELQSQNSKEDLESGQNKNTGNQSELGGITEGNSVDSNSIDSDDEITADQEFDFIENRKSVKKIKPQNVADEFSVNTGLESANLTNLKRLPTLRENEFVEMMENFQGFVLETSETKGSDGNKSDFVGTFEAEGEKEIINNEVSSSNEASSNDMNGEKPTPPNHDTQQATTEKDVETEILKSGHYEKAESELYEHPVNPPEHTPTSTYSSVNKTSIKSPSFSEEKIEKMPYELYNPQGDTKTSTPNNTKQPLYSPHKEQNIHDHYKTLPLPKSPDIAQDDEDLNVSPDPKMMTPRRNTVDKIKEEDRYTPLLSHEFSAESIQSAAGISAFEKDLSFHGSTASLARETNESYYASLVAVSKREEENRKSVLVNPWFILSVGVGHVDFRKRARSTNSLDFLRSFSSSEPEPLIILWKIT